MTRFILIITAILQITYCNEISYKEFINKVYENSKELIRQNAITKSLQNESYAANAWESPYVEISPSFGKNATTNKFEAQAQILLMITPKMPWVSSVIEDVYTTKINKNEKILQLQKNIIAIGAKRNYLTYLIYKEQEQIYKDKESLAKNALEIAQKRFDANRISKAELLRFNNDYSNALSTLKSHQILLKDMLDKLKMLVGDDHFYGINNLEFSYLGDINLENNINNSIYNEILKLDALDYEQSAKIIGMSIMDSMQIGAGYTTGQNSIDTKLVIPLPFTSKASHQQQALLELKGAGIRESQITKMQIAQSAKSYKEQLQQQEEVIKLQIQNEQNSKNLFDIMQKGFDTGVISVFEYLNTKNNYLNSRISTTQEKLNYINILSLLEENLGIQINTKETK